MAFNFLKKLIGVDSQEENIKYSDLRTNPSNQSGNDCTGVLNLKKNDVLDSNGKLVKSDKNIVYYGAKKAKGIFLNGDNFNR